jgi:hypothetical protein
MTNSELQELARICEVIREVIGCDFRCHHPDAHPREYGLKALLILMHDRDEPLNKYVNYDCGQYGDIERLDAALEKIGYYVEDCTGWYSGVYPLTAPKEVSDE